MDAKLLESALRRVYPAGTVYEMAEGALDDKERDGRIRSVLQYCAAECRLNWGVDVFTTPAYTIWLTQKEHPSFHEWAGMKVPEQIASVVKRGEPYPVLWLRISRVADYYYHYFNHWTPRGGTGYMDADFI